MLLSNSMNETFPTGSEVMSKDEQTGAAVEIAKLEFSVDAQLVKEQLELLSETEIAVLERQLSLEGSSLGLFVVVEAEQVGAVVSLLQRWREAGDDQLGIVRDIVELVSA